MRGKVIRSNSCEQGHLSRPPDGGTGPAGSPCLPCLAPVQQQAEWPLAKAAGPSRGSVWASWPPAALCSARWLLLVLLWRGQAHPGCILQLPGLGLESGVSFPGDTVGGCQDRLRGGCVALALWLLAGPFCTHTPVWSAGNSKAWLSSGT